MAYRMSTEGLEDVNRMLRALGDNAESAASRALYEGAGIMADSMEKAAQGIRTAPFRYAKNGETRMPSPEERDVVNGRGAIGIAKFRKDTMSVDTSVGYARSGYAKMVGKTVPIPKIANAINSGTSFMQKQPFVRKAVSSGGKRAEEAIRKSIEETMENLINNNGGK